MVRLEYKQQQKSVAILPWGHFNGTTVQSQIFVAVALSLVLVLFGIGGALLFCSHLYWVGGWWWWWDVSIASGLFAHVVRPLTIRLAPPFATSFRRKLRALLFLLFFFFLLL